MSSDMLKLYDSSGSPNSRRVRIFLAEKGICALLVPVDLGAKEQFSDAYVRINPRRVVPTLVIEDGTAIGEVPAIQRYLEETHANAPLLGTDPKDKALVAMWERRMELEGFAVVMDTVRNAAAGLAGVPSRGRTITSKSRRWSSAASSVWRIFRQISKPGSAKIRSSRATGSAWLTSPPSSRSTLRPRLSACRSSKAMRRRDAGKISCRRPSMTA